MPLPRLLGLAGHAGVGKSTAAAALAEGYGFEVGGFARGLKEIAVRFFGLDLGPLDRAKAVWATGKAPTPEMQAAAGVVRKRLWEIGRAMLAVDPECLDRAAMHFADTALEAVRDESDARIVRCPDGLWRPRVVFDDVRRATELSSIRRRGGTVIWLDGPTSFPVDGKDTEVRPEHCDAVVDVSWAAEEAARLRKRGLKSEARATFGVEAVRAMIQRCNWNVGEPVHIVLPDDEDDVAEPGEVEPEAAAA